MKNVYLDYSATTMVDCYVLEKFNDLVKNTYANPNSLHDLGLKSKSVINKSIENITNYFDIGNDEIIFTSGSSESNNTVIKGLIENSNRKKIITTYLEHSSILSPLSYLQVKGYAVEFVKINPDGKIDIDDLKSKLDNNTLLVSITYVDSELGTLLNTDEVFKVVKEYDNNIYTHSDITQGLGKVNINLDNIDMASFSGHKIYTFKGIGGLIRKNVKLVPLIHGGKSTSIYRSGTPSTELIYSLSCAFDLFKDSIDNKYNYVLKLNNKLRKGLSKYKRIVINSSKRSIPNILNFSIIGIDSGKTQKYFNDHGIYISTKSACSSDKNMSLAIKNMYNDEERARSSIRVSISYRTTDEEINYFLEVLSKYMEDVNENS